MPLTFHPHALKSGRLSVALLYIGHSYQSARNDCRCRPGLFGIVGDEQADGKKIPRWKNVRVVKWAGRGPAMRCCVAEKKDAVEAAAADNPDQTEHSAGLTIAELEHFVDNSVALATFRLHLGCAAG